MGRVFSCLKTLVFKNSGPGLIVLSGLAAYWNAVQNPFVYDDLGFVASNPAIQNFKNVLLLWSPDYYTVTAGMASYRPIGAVLWILDYALFKNHSAGFHLSSLFIHLINSFLVYRIGKALSLSESAAAVAGILFALHPAHTEAVNCVVFNGDLLTTLFMLLAVENYLHLSRTGWNLWRASGLILAAGTALFSKETALVLPALLVFFEALKLRPPMDVKTSRRIWAGLAGVTAIYLWVRFGPMRSPLETSKGYIGGSLISNLMTIAQLPFNYLRLLVFPARLSIYHDIPILSGWKDTQLWLHVLFLASLGFVLSRICVRSRLAFFFAIWIFLGLIPVLNFIPFASYKTLFSERFLYFPSVGFCWLAARTWSRIQIHYPKNSKFCAALVLILLGFRTHLRNKDWKNDEILLSRAVRSAPFIAGSILGSRYFMQGNFSAAAREFTPALENAPDEADASWVRENLAISLQYLGRNQEGIRLLLESLEKGNRSARLYANLGTAYYRIREYRPAAKYLEQATVLEPDNAQMRFNLELVRKALRNASKTPPVN